MPTDASTRELRDALDAERTSLRAQLSELGYGSKLDYDSNFADSSQVTAERGENEMLVNSLIFSLRDVEHALEKMDAGTYGTCENCGQPISEARLEAMPEARLCIVCAAKNRA